MALLVLLAGCTDEDDDTGGIEDYPIQTSFAVNDFAPSAGCASCHPDQYREWSGSMHAYAMHDPLWAASHLSEQQAFPLATGHDLGEFCLMCHSPVGFLTGAITEPAQLTLEAVAALPEPVRDGIGCAFCHSITHMSPTFHIDASKGEMETAEYYLDTGGPLYGPIADPLANSAHTSDYHPGYDRSEYCRACHDLIIGGEDAEVTFTEWAGTAFQTMSVECQTCHMITYAGYAVDPVLFPQAPYRENLHRHNFPGVDLVLNSFPHEAEQREAVELLLATAAELSFSPQPPDSVETGDTVEVQVVVANLAGHNIPTGVTFARQLWVEVVASSGSDTLYLSGGLDENGDLYDFHIDPQHLVDPDLAIFNTVLYNAAGDSGLRQVSVELMSHLNDYTIPPSDSRTASYSFIVPETAQGEINLSVRLRMRALPPFVLRGAGLEEAVSRLVIFDLAAISRSLLVRPD